jgi:adenylylsulfate kinase
VVKILVMGLPGSGKTTLATALAERLRCPHFNADDIRENINKDLGFTLEDRIEHAKRMGHLCDIASQWGNAVVADFVCPTEATRRAFGADFVVWMDTIDASRYEDTNALFVPPTRYDYRITDMDYHVEAILHSIFVGESRGLSSSV